MKPTVAAVPQLKPLAKVKLSIAPLESKVTPDCSDLSYCLYITQYAGLDPSICFMGGRLAAVADY